MDASRPLRFHKMEGAGNDFVVVYASELPSPIDAELAIALCDRHFGVGADGVLVVGLGDTVEPAELRGQAALSMTVWNADGSISSMCGNGLRCVVRRALDDGRWAGEDGVMAAGTGLVPFAIVGDEVRTTLGAPRVSGALTVMGPRGPVRGHVVSMGNPHFVVFDDEQDLPLGELTSWAPAIEVLPAFPARTNVEQVRREGEDFVVRVWERGVGETLACGSGACAVVVAARATGRTTADAARVLLPGGALSVEWAGPGQPVHLRGPARTVFSGEWIPSEEQR